MPDNSYSMQSVALDNDVEGWSMLAASVPLASYAARVTDVQIAGHRGSLLLPSTFDAPIASFVIGTPGGAPKERLLALMMKNERTLSRTADPSKIARLQFMSSTVEDWGASLESDQDETFIYRLVDVFWRDLDAITSDALAISGASVVGNVMPGLSAPVSDAIHRIKGGITNPRVTDADGSYFAYAGVIAAGTYLRYEADTGRAFTTPTDTWFGGTEVDVSVSADPECLELTPQYVAASPLSAKVTVTSSARTGTPTYEVRGRRAYNS